ncbi:Ig-like domain-containing protein [Dactylosporangium sp. NPDC051484]|uniref:Ig-like domain-containing protein n=1 Tax=Dactylosporangium sp. NPDC051484 TaxID=3154942 RepID=UPI003450143D
MNRSHRLAAALAGAVVLAGVTAAPAMAATNLGELTITPASGQLQFGEGNPADPLRITPGLADCPQGTEAYSELLTAPGAETDIFSGASLIPGGTINRDPGNTVLKVPPHDGTFQSGSVQSVIGDILPFGTTDAQLSPADAAKAPGTRIAEGQFSVAGVCIDQTYTVVAQSAIKTVTFSAATRPPQPPGWPAGQFYDNLQWSWSFGTPSGPATTTVTLTAAPATSAPAGTTVNLTATVSPAGAGGKVAFLDGTTSLGEKPVTAGAASLSTDGLSVGSHSLKAVFTPEDSTAYSGSTGNLTYEITEQGGGGQSGTVTLQTTVPTGGTEALTLTVDQTAAVSLPPAVRDGDNYVTGSNAVSLVTVSDTRSGSKPGWNVNGKVSANFVGTNASNTFSGTALGWKPLIVDQSAGQSVTAGASVAPGTQPGLTASTTLANAPQGSGIGAAKLGADLNLRFPATTPADTYHATVTITAI